VNPAYRLIAVLQIVLVLVLILITLLVFFPLQRQLSDQVLNLKNDILSLLESSLGNNISFSSIHPSIFSYIEIRNLRLYNDADQTLLTIDRLIFRYDIREILKGEPLSAPRLVELRGGVAYADQFASGGDRPSSEGADLEQYINELSTDLSIILRNYRIEYRDPQFILRSLISRGELRYSGEAVEISLENTSEYLGVDRGLREISGSSTIQGQVLVGTPGSLQELISTSVFQFYVSTGTVESNRFVLQPVDVYFSLDSERLLARSLEGRQPFSLEFEYFTADQRSSLAFSSSRWSPSSILRFEEMDESYNRLLASVISSGITLDFDSRFVPVRGDGWIESAGWVPVIDRVATLETQFDYSRRRFSLEALRLATESGDYLGLRGDYLLDGGALNLIGQVSNRSITGIPRFSTGFQIDYADSQIAAVLNESSIEGLALADSEIAVELGTGTVSASLQSGIRGSDAILVLMAESRGDQLLVPENLSVELRMENLGLAEINKAYADYAGLDEVPLDIPPDLLQAELFTRIIAQIESPMEEPVLSLQAREFDVIAGERDILSLRAAYKNGNISLNDLKLNYGPAEIELDLLGNVSNRFRYQFEVGAGINGFPYQANINYYPQRRGLFAVGSYGSNASLQINDDDAKLSFQISRLPLESLGEAAYVRTNGSAILNLQDPASSQIEVEALRLSDARLFPLENGETGSVELSLSGSLADGFAIPEIFYEDDLYDDRDFSRLSGSGSIDIENTGVRFALELGNDLEQASASARLADGRIDARAEILRLPTRRLGISDIVGLVNMEIRALGELTDPRLDFTVSTEAARFADDPLFMSAAGTLTREALRISSGEFELTSIGFQDVSADIDLIGGNLDAEGLLLIADATGEKNPAQLISAELRLPRIPALIQDRGATPILSDYWIGGRGSVQLSDAQAGSGDAREWNLVLEEEGDALLVSGGPDYSPDAVFGRLEADGAFSASFAEELPVSFAADGFFEGSNFDLNLTSLNMDISALMADSETGDMYFLLLGGTASGGLRITGSLVDPDFYGTLMVRNLEAGLPELIPENLTAETAFVILEGKEFFIPETRIEIGPDGSSALSGALSMDRWLPDTMVLQVATGIGAVPIRSDFNSVVVDGFARGDVEIGFGFSDQALWVVGDLQADATGITLSSNLDQAPEEENVRSDFLLDLTVRTGRGVEFYWPARNFPILRSSAVTGESISIRYSSPPDEFALTGNVALRGGEIFYFEQNFYIRQGQIRFNESLDSFDPLLSLNAEVRSVDETGPLRVYLEIQEDRLSQLQPRFTSVPPRTEPDIIALLGGRIIDGGNDNQIEIADAVLTGSEILGQVGVFREIESEIRDRLALDLFSIRTGLFQNFLQDVIVTPDPDVPLNNNSPITLGRYLRNTTLLMGRYIGDEVFMELMVQLQEQNPVDRPANDFIGIEIDAEFSLEWATPFFDLTWTFAPENPDTLFVTDHTLTFSRDFAPGNR
jgi:translocation and assembly module TamB